MQEMMTQQGFFKQNPTTSVDKEQPIRSIVHKVQPANRSKGKQTKDDSLSEVTIYKSAVQKQGKELEEVDNKVSFNYRKRDSSSSEEPEKIDTSDELIEEDINERFIAECASQAKRDKCSRYENSKKNDQEAEIMDQNQQIIREAEAAKA